MRIAYKHVCAVAFFHCYINVGDVAAAVDVIVAVLVVVCEIAQRSICAQHNTEYTYYNIQQTHASDVNYYTIDTYTCTIRSYIMYYISAYIGTI